MTREEAIEVFNEMKKCYLGGIVDAIDMAIEALKVQEPETSDAPKSDSNVGCWYDITHNYTLEQVVSALKSRELCEDAVSRKYLLGQSYSIKFQTIDESDEEAYREKVVCVEDIEDAPSVQPVPVARVMTLEEFQASENNPKWLETKDGKHNRWTLGNAGYEKFYDNCMMGYLSIEEYGKRWRCWTSRPTDEQREATAWN